MKLKNFPPIQQANPNMCFPTAIKLILDGLRIEHSNDYLKLGIHTISKLSGFKNNSGVGNTDFAINNINSKFLNKHGYILIEKSGDLAGVELIKQILNDGNCSAPSVAVNYLYFSETHKGYEVYEQHPNILHQLVILDLYEADNQLGIFDPFSFRIKNPPTEIRLSIPNFTRYWANSDANKSILWIEKSKKEAGRFKNQRRL